MMNKAKLVQMTQNGAYPLRTFHGA